MQGREVWHVFYCTSVLPGVGRSWQKTQNKWLTWIILMSPFSSSFSKCPIVFEREMTSSFIFSIFCWMRSAFCSVSWFSSSSMACSSSCRNRWRDSKWPLLVFSINVAWFWMDSKEIKIKTLMSIHYTDIKGAWCRIHYNYRRFAELNSILWESFPRWIYIAKLYSKIWKTKLSLTIMWSTMQSQWIPASCIIFLLLVRRSSWERRTP